MGVQVQVKQPLLQFKEKWLARHQKPQVGPFADEITVIKGILKDHDTQNNLLPLKYHRHIKPPVQPLQRHLVEKEVVAGKAVPFSKVMVKKERRAMKLKTIIVTAPLRTIYESDESVCKRTQAPISSLIK
ncbi:hypothetical protein DYB28_013101 [Aphanomyces astaci]|nr:hypothetical protein DYB36_014308 [Aphanomyces astaci]RHY35748.1 hypothetical protein DYB25_014211 [Aphanomyces astaci]RHY74770.1 hypothetical protein DYB34_014303 [Aphanomyces astaci]RHY76961.1 hypothetical protein DYB38_014259 [Aphanomyces astaci]RHZ11845.1 hypothetical protein DYB31_006985 [Aphanomyces astaci]